MTTYLGQFVSQAAFSVGTETAILMMASGGDSIVSNPENGPLSGGGNDGHVERPATKILIADDDPSLLRTATRLFTSRLGFKVEDIILTANVPEAMEAFDREQRSIRVILSDMRMPGGFGIDLYRHVRVQRNRPLIPFAFWSGKMPDQIRNEMEQILTGDPLSVFFEKPVDMDPFAAWFRSALLI